MNNDFGHKLQQAFKLIEELSKRPRTVSEVAAIMNCSHRTASRWICLMRSIGFEVVRIIKVDSPPRYQIDTDKTPKFVLNFIK